MNKTIRKILRKIEGVSDYDIWWECMNIPLMNIPQEDLEWAAQQDQFNSYTSKNNFLAEIERRKNNARI